MAVTRPCVAAFFIGSNDYDKAQASSNSSGKGRQYGECDMTVISSVPTASSKTSSNTSSNTNDNSVFLNEIKKLCRRRKNNFKKKIKETLFDLSPWPVKSKGHNIGLKNIKKRLCGV